MSNQGSTRSGQSSNPAPAATGEDTPVSENGWSGSFGSLPEPDDVSRPGEQKPAAAVPPPAPAESEEALDVDSDDIQEIDEIASSSAPVPPAADFTPPPIPRDRTPSGSTPTVAARERIPTGAQPAVGGRERAPSGGFAVAGARERIPTGSSPTVGGRDARPSGSLPMPPPSRLSGSLPAVGATPRPSGGFAAVSASPSPRPAPSATATPVASARPVLSPTTQSAAASPRRPARPTGGFVAIAAPSGPPAIDAFPFDGPIPDGPDSWVNSPELFRAESQKAARSGRWKQLAGMTAHALLHSSHATGAARTGMLLDLARIFRDRLRDEVRAEQAFAALVRESPGNAEAIAYLADIYAKRREWRSAYDLHANAVDQTWDPNERVAWTREAVRIAQEELNDLALSIRAWERLWKLRDATEEAASELKRLYRAAGKWDSMAEFLEQQIDTVKGTERVVALRELAEIRLTGLSDEAGAARIFERIVADRANDPLAIAQLARLYARSDHDAGIARLRDESGLEGDALLDRKRLVAGALWDAGRQERACAVYDAILEAEPNDRMALARALEFRRTSGRYAELVAKLVAEADRAESDSDRCSRLAEAADVAEKLQRDPAGAIRLQERRLALLPEDRDTHEALARLYDVSGNHAGLASALEGLLRHAKEPADRIPLLRRAGDLAASRIRNDARAESAWKEILELDHRQIEVRESLIDLYRRRSDWSALDDALARQIALVRDPVRLQALWRAVAENLEAHFQDPARSIGAWTNVLDLAPDDLRALDALDALFEKLGRAADLLHVLERRARSTQDSAHRLRLWARMGALLEQQGRAGAAIAIWERTLRASPGSEEAVDNLIRLYVAGNDRAMAIELLESSIATAREPASRIALLRRELALVPPDAHADRFALLRRILLQTDDPGPVLDELRAVVETSALWEPFVALLQHLATEQPEGPARTGLIRESAEILEKRLAQPRRAFLLLQAFAISPIAFRDVEADLTRLGEVAEAHEEMLALLDRLSGIEAGDAARRERIIARAAICERRMNDASRAFTEYRRLLYLDPADTQALAELERLSVERDQRAAFDAVLAEMSDCATSIEEHLRTVERRETLARSQFGQPERAFLRLVQRFRLAPATPGLRDALLADAATLDRWSIVLPLIEGELRSAPDGGAPDRLAELAGLYDARLRSPADAFALYAASFHAVPDAPGVGEHLERLAASEDQLEELGRSLRHAAATTAAADSAAAFLRRAASVYSSRLARPDASIELHRRVLDLHASDLPSIRVLIDHHRSRSESRDLAERLRSWVGLVEAPADRVSGWAELAELAESRFSDPGAAIEAWSRVTEVEPSHAVGRERLDALLRTATDPALQTRFLRVEMTSATPERRGEIALRVAKLLDESLHRREEAITVLTEASPESDEAVHTTLCRMLSEESRHEAVVRLCLARAAVATDPPAKGTALRAALAAASRGREVVPDELREQALVALAAVDPADSMVRRELTNLLRRTGRFDELSRQLDSQRAVADAETARDLEFEQARVLARNLGRPSDAAPVYSRILAAEPGVESAILGLASVALAASDVGAYIERRRQQAEKIDPVDAALVLCHLGEVADEHGLPQAKLVDCYRQARALDVENVPAREALKGIGRHLKLVRPACALLPEEGEREMSWAQRAARMGVLASEAAERGEPHVARDWLRRAVAVDPDASELWTRLAESWRAAGDLAAAFRAETAAFRARERSTPVTGDSIQADAAALTRLADSARAAGDDRTWRRLVARAFDLAPDNIPAGVACARLALDAGKAEEAHPLLDSILTHERSRIPGELLPEVLFARGRTLRERGDHDAALEDFRAAVSAAPLHPGALTALAEAESAAHLYAPAIEHHLRALMVARKPEERAALYYQLGVMWEDGLREIDEAGACFELAFREGLSTRELLHRLLGHYERSGRLDRGQDVVDQLLESAETPAELTRLWLARGQILAHQPGSEERAVEAFDNALSYDPSCHEARQGLTIVLERRGDWDQLLGILDAMAQDGTPAQQAEAWRRIGEISLDRLGDRTRAERYLRQSFSTRPSAAAAVRMEELCASDPKRAAERLVWLGHLAAFGPRCYGPAARLGQMILDAEPRRGWCLLAPAATCRDLDDSAKARLKEMRREAERPPSFVPSSEDRKKALPDDYPALLLSALSELGAAVPLGYTKLDDLRASEPADVSPHSSTGRTFGAVAEAMGLGGVLLHRAKSPPEPVLVVASDPPVLLVQGDTLQQVVRAELGYLLAFGLELARPEHRFLASLAPDVRELVVPALWRALGFTETAPARVARIAERITEGAPEELRAKWAESLAPLRGKDPAELGRSAWGSVLRVARRIGLLAGPDLLQTFRAVSRLEPAVARPGVYATLADVDNFVEAAAPLHDIVGFAASDAFAQLLRSSTEVGGG